MPRMFEDRPGDDPTSHAAKLTEGADGDVGDVALFA
jgi:hypothetical protein